jgi:hypothetical protein
VETTTLTVRSSPRIVSAIDFALDFFRAELLWGNPTEREWEAYGFLFWLLGVSRSKHTMTIDLLALVTTDAEDYVLQFDDSAEQSLDAKAFEEWQDKEWLGEEEEF